MCSSPRKRLVPLGTPLHSLRHNFHRINTATNFHENMYHLLLSGESGSQYWERVSYKKMRRTSEYRRPGRTRRKSNNASSRRANQQAHEDIAAIQTYSTFSRISRSAIFQLWLPEREISRNTKSIFPIKARR